MAVGAHLAANTGLIGTGLDPVVARIILDGAPLRTAIHGAVRMRPSVEALQEFKVEAGFYQADLGTESGAQIISAIRPGTRHHRRI